METEWKISDYNEIDIAPLMYLSSCIRTKEQDAIYLVLLTERSGKCDQFFVYLGIQRRTTSRIKPAE
jgi:hypothetical protein